MYQTQQVYTITKKNCNPAEKKNFQILIYDFTHTYNKIANEFDYFTVTKDVISYYILDLPIKEKSIFMYQEIDGTDYKIRLKIFNINKVARTLNFYQDLLLDTFTMASYSNMLITHAVWMDPFIILSTNHFIHSYKILVNRGNGDNFYSVFLHAKDTTTQWKLLDTAFFAKTSPSPGDLIIWGLLMNYTETEIKVVMFRPNNNGGTNPAIPWTTGLFLDSTTNNNFFQCANNYEEIPNIGNTCVDCKPNFTYFGTCQATCPSANADSNNICAHADYQEPRPITSFNKYPECSYSKKEGYIATWATCAQCSWNGEYTWENACISACVDGTKIDADNEVCYQCAKSSPATEGGVCVSTCANPAHIIQNYACVAACSGLTPKKYRTECLVVCPEHTWDNAGVCTPCLASEYMDTTDGTCKGVCPDILFSTDSPYKKCVICEAPNVKEETTLKCLASCAAGTTLNSITRICEISACPILTVMSSGACVYFLSFYY